ncbi:MAG TPA: cell division ATP-binding protein FtsE, partial [Ruminococcaceae bacterium]|nr:cell division ATP-binding protein FtsE [Oscillospiraceae bacterium]
MVELKNVNVHYRDGHKNGVDALHDINLRINDGEFVFIVGDSGAGKSTMLKLLTREIVPTTGRVFVNGYNLSKMKNKKIPYFRRSLGMIFQDFRLIPDMTVYENVAFVLRVTDKSNKYIRQRVPYVLNLVKLADKAKAKPTQLSGGEQQRVA